MVQTSRRMPFKPPSSQRARAACRVFQRLLDASGVGLRAMYLPGLQGLKQQLRMLEWLLERIMPALKDHLQVTRDSTGSGGLTKSMTSVTGDALDLYRKRAAAPFCCSTCRCLLSAAGASAA